MEKFSVKEIVDANLRYKELENNVHELYKELKKVNSMIDLEEVQRDLNYGQVKELFNMLSYSISEKDVQDELEKIMDNKKIEEYPKILGVHYYPIIKEMDFISEERKIELDRFIEGCNRRASLKRDISIELNSEEIKFLVDNEILEPIYSFYCNCCGNCEPELITQSQKDKFYEYHNFDYKNKTKEEICKHQEDNFGDGYIEVGCWNDGYYEVTNIEEFEHNVSEHIKYNIKVKPDMTLDNI